MTFKIGDIVQLNPQSIIRWTRERNLWWIGYQIVPEYTTFIISAINDNHVLLKFMDGTLLGNLKPNDIILAHKQNINPVFSRINKLYKKCKTTQHWSIE